MDGHARTELESESASVCALREKRVGTGRFPSLRARSKVWMLRIPVVGGSVNPIHAFRSRSDPITPIRGSGCKRVPLFVTPSALRPGAPVRAPEQKPISLVNAAS